MSQTLQRRGFPYEDNRPPVVSFPDRLGPMTSTPDADAKIAAILQPHMTADWLASLTNGMTPGVVRALRALEAGPVMSAAVLASPVRATKIEAARKAYVLAPANDPAKDTALDRLYLLVVGPPPPGSKPLRTVTA